MMWKRGERVKKKTCSPKKPWLHIEHVCVSLREFSQKCATLVNDGGMKRERGGGGEKEFVVRRGASLPLPPSLLSKEERPTCIPCTFSLFSSLFFISAAS